MKIAVISDIHGNMQALESVLEDVKNEKCDKIFCLGDLALAGPQSEETVNKIKTLSQSPDFEIIQGNTDEYLGADSEAVHQAILKANVVMGNAYESDLKVLTKGSIEFLKNLPKSKEIEIGNINILLVHGSPRANNENIYPNLQIEKVEEMIAGTNADLIFCGHTHMPCGYQTNTKQTVVNVGSVGRPLNLVSKACYALVEITDAQAKEFFVSHKFVNYDKEKSSELMAKRGYEGAKKLAQIILTADEDCSS